MMASKTGYGRYLDKQFRQSGSFFSALFEAIQQADETNTAKLKAGFPEEVDAYRLWTRVGAQSLLAKVRDLEPEHGILKKIDSGEYLL